MCVSVRVRESECVSERELLCEKDVGSENMDRLLDMVYEALSC